MATDNVVGYRILDEVELAAARAELRQLSKRALDAMKQNGTLSGPHPRIVALQAEAAARAAALAS